ncbi:aspartyl-phosphate phosphatase Spo0E family protein [Ammoniphilus sp. 3BR4]
MLLKDLLSLKRSIEEDRKSMSHLAKKKGIQDPEVIKFSQELDEKIVNLQRVLLDIQAM